MIKRLSVLLAVAFSSLAITCSNTPVRIQGRVMREETNQPIAGAWVYDPTIKVAKAIPDSANATQTKELTGDPQVTTTDSLGYYVLEGVSPRRHFIYFAAKDHEPSKVDFWPRSRKDSYIINAQLEPSPIEVKY